MDAIKAGADGVFYHKLVLARVPGVELPKVVSEGEQRCPSIAAFFAELSTADEPSGMYSLTRAAPRRLAKKTEEPGRGKCGQSLIWRQE